MKTISNILLCLVIVGAAAADASNSTAAPTAAPRNETQSDSPVGGPPSLTPAPAPAGNTTAAPTAPSGGGGKDADGGGGSGGVGGWKVGFACVGAKLATNRSLAGGGCQAWCEARRAAVFPAAGCCRVDNGGAKCFLHNGTALLNNGDDDSLLLGTPTEAPTPTPAPATDGPTGAPTDAPTGAPTGAPTKSPTAAVPPQTQAPTNAPTAPDDCGGHPACVALGFHAGQQCCPMADGKTSMDCCRDAVAKPTDAPATAAPATDAPATDAPTAAPTEAPAPACADLAMAAWPKQIAAVASLAGVTACAEAVPRMANLGVKCDTDLATNAVVQAAAPGVAGKLADLCCASCKAAPAAAPVACADANCRACLTAAQCLTCETGFALTADLSCAAAPKPNAPATPPKDDGAGKDDGGDLSTGAIVGIASACVAGLLALAFVCASRRRRQQHSDDFHAKFGAGDPRVNGGLVDFVGASQGKRLAPVLEMVPAGPPPADGLTGGSTTPQPRRVSLGRAVVRSVDRAVRNWRRPSQAQWREYVDPASQRPYYVNVLTLATQWERPVVGEIRLAAPQGPPVPTAAAVPEPAAPAAPTAAPAAPVVATPDGRRMMTGGHEEEGGVNNV